MFPILLEYKLTAGFFSIWGPKGWMAQQWMLWVAGLVISLGLAWWGLAPETEKSSGGKGRRVLGILGILGTLGFGLVLGGVAAGRFQRPIKLHTYGVLVAVGFLLGIILSLREAKRVGEDPEKILDLAFWLLLAAMVGARLFFVAVYWPEFAADFRSSRPWYQWRLFHLWEGGLIFYGGLLAALLTSAVFVRVNRLNFWRLADIVIPSVALGQFFGSLGSYAAGFGYGKISSVPWAVTFMQGPSGLPRGMPLHPTQLYGALAAMVLFFALLWIRSHKRYHGQAFVWYLLLYPVCSFVIDIFRGDTRRGLIHNLQKDVFEKLAGPELLSWSQLAAIIFFGVALYFVIRPPQSLVKAAK
ncbi:MAG: prolipoprotein diacylglyceryl transferase [Myxococcota bacterium]